MGTKITISQEGTNPISIEISDKAKSQEASVVLFGANGRLGDKPGKDLQDICKKFSNAMKKFIDSNKELKTKNNFKIDKECFSDTFACALGHFGVAEEHRDDPSGHMTGFHPFIINGDNVILGSGFPLEFYSYETDKKDDKIFPNIEINGKYFTAFISGSIDEKGLLKKTYIHKIGMALILYGAADLYR